MKLFIIIFIAIFSSIGLICLIALLRNLKNYSPSGEHDHSSSLTHHFHDNSASHHHSASHSNDCSSSSDSGSYDSGGGGD
ncbi:hypothetical protein KTI78_00610 [Acinetobacter sp. WU_MDCI_Abxe161]|uniref:hypothetical protein n=1 Tax=Acinetobacter sp. WU_MDCI_Abxe161 TaxID=2850074 RepID=UPI0021CD21FC|nr:hypothetical protein [Acinetobacter sp. WU_MDCI_Abxe161]MCU4501663.1 hypothetical protein [Acinetobacter sp. WU_MDCI_Abxe161]